jgi:hypothetical protein
MDADARGSSGLYAKDRSALRVGHGQASARGVSVLWPPSAGCFVPRAARRDAGLKG